MKNSFQGEQFKYPPWKISLQGENLKILPGKFMKNSLQGENLKILPGKFHSTEKI